MASVNKVTLIGNLGRDPEVRTTPTGQKVANFSLATTERYKDQSGNNQEKTEWHNLVAWARQAEIIEQYAKKGTSLYVEGSLTTRSWETDAGEKRFKTDIVVRNFQFLGNKNDNQSDNRPPQQQQSGGFGGTTEPEDDLPF